MNNNVSKFLIIFIIAAVAFTSCQKEEAVTESKTNDPVLERILDFKKDVENPNFKSGTYIDVEDAVWLIEAALNYSYCIVTEEQANAGTNVIVRDSLLYEIDIEDGQISYANVINAYLALETEMLLLLDNYTSSVKFFNFANVEFKDGGFKTYVITRYKEDLTKTGGIGGFYNITYNWYWGLFVMNFPYRAGQCDETFQGQDAITEIRKWIATRTPIYPNVYYTDIYYVGQFSSVIPAGSYLTDLSSYGVDMFAYYTDDVLWDNYEAATLICLSASECTYYAQECQQALGVIENNFIEQDEDITTRILDGYKYIYGSTGNWTGTELYHVYYIEAGTRHLVGSGS